MRTPALRCQGYAIEVGEATSTANGIIHRISNHKQTGVHVLAGFETHCEPGMLGKVKEVIMIS